MNYHAKLPAGAAAGALFSWEETFDPVIGDWGQEGAGDFVIADSGDPVQGEVLKLNSGGDWSDGASTLFGVVNCPTQDGDLPIHLTAEVSFRNPGNVYYIGVMDAALQNGYLYKAVDGSELANGVQAYVVTNGILTEINNWYSNSNVGSFVKMQLSLTYIGAPHNSVRVTVHSSSWTIQIDFAGPYHQNLTRVICSGGNNVWFDDITLDNVAELFSSNYHVKMQTTNAGNTVTVTNDFSPNSEPWVSYGDAAITTEDDPTDGWIGVSSNLGTGNGAQSNVTLASLGGTVYLPTVVGDEILLTVRIRKQAESLGTYFGLANATGDQSIQVVYLPHVSPERAKVITINGNVWTNQGDSIDNLPDTENGEWIDASLLIQMKFPGIYSAIFTVHGVSLDTGTIHNLDDRAPFTHFQLGSDGDISFTPVVAFSSFAVDNVSVDSPASKYNVRLP